LVCIGIAPKVVAGFERADAARPKLALRMLGYLFVNCEERK
jgi:hypothetical protein